MTKRIAHDEVSIEIAAPPDERVRLVSDITRMGDWSPECVRCSWTKGATGPEVGATFKARNKGGRGTGLVQHPDGDRRRARSRVRLQPQRPGIGSYTWRYGWSQRPPAPWLTESFDAEQAARRRR